MVVFFAQIGGRKWSKFGTRVSKRRIDVCLANTLPCTMNMGHYYDKKGSLQHQVAFFDHHIELTPLKII